MSSLTFHFSSLPLSQLSHLFRRFSFAHSTALLSLSVLSARPLVSSLSYSLHVVASSSLSLSPVALYFASAFTLLVALSVISPLYFLSPAASSSLSRPLSPHSISLYRHLSPFVTSPVYSFLLLRRGKHSRRGPSNIFSLSRCSSRASSASPRCCAFVHSREHRPFITAGERDPAYTQRAEIEPPDSGAHTCVRSAFVFAPYAPARIVGGQDPVSKCTRDPDTFLTSASSTLNLRLF